MNDKISFYLQQKNKLFNGSVLSVCYKADKNEIKEYGLTNENVLLLIKDNKINDWIAEKDIDYVSKLKEIFKDKEIFLRIQSECLLGMYGDSHCDCEIQRINSIKLIEQKNGIFIHLPQEAQGWGLHYKLKELELQVSGRNTDGKFIGVKNRDDAQRILIGNNNFNDFRSYGIVYKIIEMLGLSDEKFILISESERKLKVLKESGLKVIKYIENKDKDVNPDNLSEYLIKILNETHEFEEGTIDKIIQLISDRKYNSRTLSTLVSIVDKINNDKNYILDSRIKKKFLDVYDKIICGIEKRYIVDESVIKIQNNFSCRVNSSIFKAIQNMYGKNIFDRISLEKMYYFESKTEFSSLDQMLLGIDDILDRAGECQRDTRLRTTFKKEPTVKHTSMGDEQFADYLTSSMAERMPPAFNPDTLRVKEGKLASYFIRVLARQHSSMQGVINRAGKDGVCVFRSEMELLRLIRDDLTAECSWNKRKAGK